MNGERDVISDSINFCSWRVRCKRGGNVLFFESLQGIAVKLARQEIAVYVPCCRVRFCVFSDIYSFDVCAYIPLSGYPPAGLRHCPARRHLHCTVDSSNPGVSSFVMAILLRGVAEKLRACVFC